MKRAFTAIALAICSTAAFAETNCESLDGVVVPAYCHNKRITIQPIANGGTAAINGSGNSTSTAQAISNGGSNNVTVEGSTGAVVPRMAPQAPDVIAYPTAPCRVAVGASGSWLIGSAGVTGSVPDENCQRIETSRHLHNLGQQTAAVQVMCLSADAKQALEAVGVKCLISAPPPAERVAP